jgi:hypothetical protein
MEGRICVAEQPKEGRGLGSGFRRDRHANQRQAGAELRTDLGLKAPSIFITHPSGDIIVMF